MTGNSEILGRRNVLQGWMDVDLVHLRIAGEEAERALVRHPSGIAVLAYDPERKVASTVRETRLAVLNEEAPTLAEPVAGVLESDEEPAEAARREVREELGLELTEFEFVARVWMTPSSTTERVHLFLAPYGEEDRVASGGGVDGEQEHLEIVEVPLAHLWRDAHDGDRVGDAKLFMLLQALRLRRPDLFA